MNLELITKDFVKACLPDRDPWAHKGDFGKVLLLCGSRGYTGAAYLSAMGALRSGAGLVFLGVPESIYGIEAVKLNEAIVFPLPQKDGKLSRQAIPEVLERLRGIDAVLIGCGLGQSEDVTAVVLEILAHAKCPVVLDADGINVMAAHKDILRGRRSPTILTPHQGEFLRFGGEVGEDRAESTARFARQWNSIVLLKGHETFISDGTTCYKSCTGNPGMAVGGSGDMLSGMIVGLLGQKLDPPKASACAAWLHGTAGDICAGEMGQYAMLPTDMLAVLPRLLK